MEPRPAHPLSPPAFRPLRTKKSSLGATLGIGAVMVIVVVSALFFWGERIAQEEGRSPNVELAP